MTENDQPLSEHKIFFTEEELAEELAIPEELKVNTIQQLQEECTIKVESARTTGAMISLICLAGTTVLSILNYENCQDRKEHTAKVKRLEKVIANQNIDTDGLQEELTKTKDVLKTTLQLRNSNTQFVKDVIGCNVKKRAFKDKGRCLQKALRSRFIKRDKAFKRIGKH